MVGPMKKNAALLALLALLAIPACDRQAKSETAVRQAIERYLAARPNLNLQGMELQVSNVRFQGERAEADVMFRAKSDGKAALSMHYNLRREGGGWRVTPQSSGHGMMPPEAGESMPELPGGHLPVGSSSPPSPAPELPPGHPPVKGR